MSKKISVYIQVIRFFNYGLPKHVLSHGLGKKHKNVRSSEGVALSLLQII